MRKGLSHFTKGGFAFCESGFRMLRKGVSHCAKAGLAVRETTFRKILSFCLVVEEMPSNLEAVGSNPLAYHERVDDKFVR